MPDTKTDKLISAISSLKTVSVNVNNTGTNFSFEDFVRLKVALDSMKLTSCISHCVAMKLRTFSLETSWTIPKRHL